MRESGFGSLPFGPLSFGRPSFGRLGAVRERAGAAIRRNLGATDEDLGEYSVGVGDAGLFGPDSPVWMVHGDLPAMLIGGFAALMTQTLHPLAMAGVAAHSNYREDPTGRLRRTARFIAGTTFGARPFVLELVGEVKKVHEAVVGISPDGRPYSASDPDLLTFVHVSEVASFLASYQRYAPRPLLRVEKDRYFDEVAVIAEMLGALDVPHSVGAIRTYQRQIVPELVRTDQASEALRFLMRSSSRELADIAAQRVITAAASELLPGPVRSMVDPKPLSIGQRTLVRASATAFSAGVRWAIGPSVVRAKALARIAAA
jgi:uncharacterized protein (DUF2236 family)